MPWLSPIKDNLEFLMGDSQTLENYIEQGVIELEAITFIRGRSISNAFIIIDESSNLDLHELKTCLTRAGDGTKIVLTGDLNQIDRPTLTATSSGFTHVIEKFKDREIAGHISLKRGERSELATISAEIL